METTKKTWIIILLVIILQGIYISIGRELHSEIQKFHKGIPEREILPARMYGFMDVVIDIFWMRFVQDLPARKFLPPEKAEINYHYLNFYTDMKPHKIEFFSIGALGFKVWNKMDKTEKILQKSIKLNPGVIDLYIELGGLFYLKTIKDYDKSVEVLMIARGFKNHPEVVDHLLEEARGGVSP